MNIGVSLAFLSWADFERAVVKPSDPPAEPDWQLYQDELALGDMAEKFGFDSLWTVEHHFSPYGVVPDPVQLLTYFAGRTSKINFGTMIAVLPWHDPVRLAEQVLMLDNMLADGRRVTLGVGRGASEREYRGMRVPMGESRERFAESLDIIRLAFSESSFSYSGSFAELSELQVRPRPRDESLASRIVFAFQSPQSMAIGARAGLGMIFTTGKNPADYAADAAAFNRIREESGWPAVRPTLCQACYCAETEAEAWEAAVEYMGNWASMGEWHYGLLRADGFEKAGGYEWWAAQAHQLADADRSHVREEFARPQIWGTPSQCVDKVRRLQETLDPTELLLLFRPAGLPLEKAQASMELFAREVLPAIREMKTGHS